MAGPNLVMFGWNRSLPGREPISGQHFQEFVEYLSVQKRNGAIESFEIVLLEPHGGNLNGFFLLFGEPAKLSELTASAEWSRHQLRGVLHLDGATTVRGFTGSAVPERMELWTREIPR
jgi:hypothetical protein